MKKSGSGTFFSRNAMSWVSSLVINVMNVNYVLNYFGYVLESIVNDDEGDDELNRSRSEKKKIRPSDDYSFNDECEYFSDDSLLSFAKTSTFTTNTSTSDYKKFITPTDSFERTLENDDFHGEDLSFEPEEGTVVFVSSVDVTQKQYSNVGEGVEYNPGNENDDDKYPDTISNGGSSGSIEMGMEIAEDEVANISTEWDDNENHMKEDPKYVVEHNEEVGTRPNDLESTSPKKIVLEECKPVRGKGKRKAKKK